MYSVSLSVFGPAGADILSLNNLIMVTNVVPTITSPPVASNTLASVDGVTVVKPGEAIGFSVATDDANGTAVSCQWNFGDGGSSTDCSPSHVFTNCGAHVVFVTIGDGFTSVTTGMVVAVACPMDISSLKLQANFKKVGSDTCGIKGTLTDLPTGFALANTAVALDVGDVTVNFTLDVKGRCVNSNGNIRFSYNKKSGTWTFTGKLKGDLKASWAKYSITNGTSVNANVTFPVLLMLQLDTLESFDAEPTMSYNNKSGVSGTATYQPVK
jgi:PKD repeat protein